MIKLPATAQLCSTLDLNYFDAHFAVSWVAVASGLRIGKFVPSLRGRDNVFKVELLEASLDQISFPCSVPRSVLELVAT